jgi:hypothetical protein
MAKVTVYYVLLWDALEGVNKLSNRMATREGAGKMSGSVLENTWVEIDDTELESGELWTRIGFRPEDMSWQGPQNL